MSVVYYESMKRKLKTKPIYECRCNGWLQTRRFTCLVKILNKQHSKMEPGTNECPITWIRIFSKTKKLKKKFSQQKGKLCTRLNLYCVTFHCVLCYWFGSSDFKFSVFHGNAFQRPKISVTRSFVRKLCRNFWNVTIHESILSSFRNLRTRTMTRSGTVVVW